MKQHRLLPILRRGACALVLLYAGAAWSHARLQQQSPAAGSAQPAPQQVRLAFSEPLEGALSRIVVMDGTGKPVTSAKASVDPAAPSVLLLPLDGSLAAGTYTVNWNVVSKDGHRTQGSYRFTVK